MKYAYIVRFPNDNGPMARMYAIRYLPQGSGKPKTLRQLLGILRREDITTPTLRRKTGGHFEWDYANEPWSTQKFHRRYPNIRLKPGEGPILVDLDDVSTNRTSRHPEY